MSYEIVDWYDLCDRKLQFTYNRGTVSCSLVDSINYSILRSGIESDTFLVKYEMLAVDGRIKLRNLKNGYIYMEYSSSGFVLCINGYELSDNSLFFIRLGRYSFMLVISDRMAELLLSNRDIIYLYLRYIFLCDGRSLLCEL